jgi:hypothetical protein
MLSTYGPDLLVPLFNDIQSGKTTTIVYVKTDPRTLLVTLSRLSGVSTLNAIRITCALE